MGVLLRLVLRPDRALLVGALGMAAAILLPVVGTLVMAGLTPKLDGDWVAYTTDGSDLRWQEADAQPTWVAARSLTNASRFSYIVGPPHVEPGAQLAMPETRVPAGVPRASATLPGLPPDAILVHPQDLGAGKAVIAGYARQPDVPSAVEAPARGSDAFEAATTASLRGQSLALILGSVPAVALVASALARQEIRARARSAATLVALGGRRAAFLLLVGRTVVAVVAGCAVAALVGFALHQRGGIYDAPDDPEGLLAAALVLPLLVAVVTGLAWARVALRGTEALKIAGPQGEDDVDWRLPARLRPILLGLRPLPLLALAALLFVADVGFPVAAAKVPASLAGGEGEWVVGAEDGLHVGAGVPGTVADVAWLDPRVEDIVAETVTPTLIDGVPAVVRGGPWERLASYHRLGDLDGDSPTAGAIVLGERLARRLGVGVGDDVAVQGGDRPDVATLRVRGLVRAPGLLADEAFVDEPTGRRLADLPPGQANLVRVRPQTQGALDALSRTTAELVVVEVAVEPPNAPAGSIAHANITVANLGTHTGQRPLTLRVADVAVARIDAVVPGHAHRSFRQPFIVPEGAWQVEVNPTADGQGTAPERSWRLPGVAVAGQPFAATLLRAGAPEAGVPVSLYRDLAAAERGDAAADATTAANGTALFVAPEPGDWLVGTRQGPTAFAQVAVVEDRAPELVVQTVWTEPATPRLGEQNRLLGQVVNPTPHAATAVLGAFAGSTRYAELNLTLQPGASTVVSFVLFLLEPVDTVGIGNATLRLGTQESAGPAPAPSGEPPTPTAAPVAPDNAVDGTAVQVEVADRALGDARAVLVALAGSATATTLAVVALVTQRTLAGRQHVVGLLQVLGFDADRVRQRAAAEGALLGGVAALAMLLPAKLAFRALGAWGPAVFAHGLPDPVGWLFALQTVAAFAGVCGLAAYFGATKA